jgi:hypothetical protein
MAGDAPERFGAPYDANRHRAPRWL